MEWLKNGEKRDSAPKGLTAAFKSSNTNSTKGNTERRRARAILQHYNSFQQWMGFFFNRNMCIFLHLDWITADIYICMYVLLRKNVPGDFFSSLVPSFAKEKKSECISVRKRPFHPGPESCHPTDRTQNWRRWFKPKVGRLKTRYRAKSRLCATGKQKEIGVLQQQQQLLECCNSRWENTFSARIREKQGSIGIAYPHPPTNLENQNKSYLMDVLILSNDRRKITWFRPKNLKSFDDRRLWRRASRDSRGLCS